jgi:hypothetical protein
MRSRRCYLQRIKAVPTVRIVIPPRVGDSALSIRVHPTPPVPQRLKVEIKRARMRRARPATEIERSIRRLLCRPSVTSRAGRGGAGFLPCWPFTHTRSASRTFKVSAGQDQRRRLRLERRTRQILKFRQCRISPPLVQDPFRMGYNGIKIILAAAKGEIISAIVDTGATLIARTPRIPPNSSPQRSH